MPTNETVSLMRSTSILDSFGIGNLFIGHRTFLGSQSFSYLS